MREGAGVMFENAHVYTGLAAGIATSVLWTGTSLLFTAAGKRIGPTVVNTLRLLLAVVLLSVTHRLLSGVWMPDANAKQVLYLAASGVIGLAIGDQALFVAFIDIGPRLSMLIMTTSPLFAAFFGWIALGEALHGVAWLGVVLTVSGIAWVVAERPPTPTVQTQQRRLRGVILSLIGAACQAGGLLLSKQGMGHGWLAAEDRLDPQAATLVRMVFAGAVMVPVMMLRRKPMLRNGGSPEPSLGRSDGADRLRMGLLYTAIGAIVGPFLGVWMSLVAGDRAPLGIAQTLCSLSPIMLLPIAAAFHKERITGRTVLGVLIAVFGAALLFIRPG